MNSESVPRRSRALPKVSFTSFPMVMIRCWAADLPEGLTFLPFSARKVNPSGKSAAQHLIITIGKLVNDTFGKALERRGTDSEFIVPLVNQARCDVIRHSHVITDKILKDHSNILPEVLDVVFTQVNAVKQDLAGRDVIQSSHQLDDSR